MNTSNTYTGKVVCGPHTPAVEVEFTYEGEPRRILICKPEGRAAHLQLIGKIVKFKLVKDPWPGIIVSDIGFAEIMVPLLL